MRSPTTTVPHFRVHTRLAAMLVFGLVWIGCANTDLKATGESCEQDRECRSRLCDEGRCLQSRPYDDPDGSRRGGDDATADTDGDTLPGADVPRDAPPGADAPFDTPPDLPPPTGCEDDSDCGPGVCVDLAGEGACIVPGCPETCPDGTICALLRGRDGGEVVACVGTSWVYCADTDLDGFGAGSDCPDPDCDDGDDTRYPGAPEGCDGIDNDCDGDVDEDAGFVNDCGGCMPLRGEIGGACGTCRSGGWACDGAEALYCAGDEGDRARNACEGCSVLANPPGGSCGSCGVGRYVCAGGDATRCEGDEDANACGGCSPLSNEPGSGCGVCDAGRYECDGSDRVRCDDPAPPEEVCNFEDDDCDGVVDPGCRRSVHRSVSRSRDIHFYSTDRAEASCCGWSLELADYFQLYTEDAPGLRPLFRCHHGALDVYLLTTSRSCESWGAGSRQAEMGFIATSAIEGTTELFRLYNPTNEDHFYTTGSHERDVAISNGFSPEGSPGFVFVP